jgi:RNA polymerase sigma-70 factor (ECF subfamily)
MSAAALGPVFLAAAAGGSSGPSASGAGASALPTAPAAEAAELEAQLSAFVAAAQAPWPDFGTDVLDFVRYTAERTEQARLPPSVHAAELWLACACARGVPAAIQAFQRDYGPVIARVLARRKAAQDVADDVHQLLAERLLVGNSETGRPPKIADYKARGPLKSWVATAAATTLATLRRSAGRRREAPEPGADVAWDGALDAELEYLKQRYAPQVQAAIVAALDGLGDREKALLRLHLGERLSIDVIGSMYGVNRATAARWLAAARRAVLEGARERLRAQLAISPSECDSLVALAYSRLDVSILQHLAGPSASP